MTLCLWTLYCLLYRLQLISRFHELDADGSGALDRTEVEQVGVWTVYTVRLGLYGSLCFRIVLQRG